MIPRFEILQEKKLVGMKLTMSFEHNRTYELWSGFMPRRKEILNTITTDLFSVQTYGSGFSFEHFDAHKLFHKWAASEVADFSSVPEGMEELVLPGGLYAVFLHTGPANKGPETFKFIFGSWLPGSGYLLDNRPHFEIIGKNYKHNDPLSEEEIWIPVKPNFH